MDTTSFKALLHDRSLKATTSRLTLLQKLQDYETAMPYSSIQEAMAPIDRVTLYRTLESLQKHGIIHKAFQENNETYYAICGSECADHHHHDNHIHFKCTECDAVTCEQPVQPIKISMPDYDIHSVSVHVQGVCQACRG